MSLNYKYRIKTASESDIYTHLNECKTFFNPPLNEKVDLKEYSTKLFRNSITFEAWANSDLIGLVAAYFNNEESKIGYITNVSVVPDFYGKGIAKKIMTYCINYAIDNNFKVVNLEVETSSIAAISLYKKLGFKTIKTETNQYVMQLKLL